MTAWEARQLLFAGWGVKDAEGDYYALIGGRIRVLDGGTSYMRELYDEAGPFTAVPLNTLGFVAVGE